MDKKTTIFDQRGQKVTYQYNAAGDINFGAVQNRMDVVVELEKLQAELDKAIEADVLDKEAATDAEYQLKKAVQQAKKPEPDKKTILDHLDQAKGIIAGVAATVTAATVLAAAFEKAIEVVQKLF
jgi:hypothetical protein